jgi:hypothetical protein
MPQIFPGQSLTAEPKNAPYERPPQMVKPEEAMLWHLNRITEPERADSILDMLELDFNVVMLTEGLLRGAVLDGRHSIDVSLIIAPVVHEVIKTMAEKAGIDFEEGFPDESDQKKDVKYQISEKKALKLLEKYEEETGEEYTDFLEPDQMNEDAEQGSANMKDITPSDTASSSEEPMESTGGGLMARPAKEGDII